MDPSLLADGEEKELMKHCSWRLRQFLGTDQNLDDLIRYMLDIEDEAKTKQYVVSYVRSSVAADRFQEDKVASFANEVVARRRKVRALRKQAADRLRKPSAAPLEGYKAYRKVRLNHCALSLSLSLTHTLWSLFLGLSPG